MKEPYNLFYFYVDFQILVFKRNKNKVTKFKKSLELNNKVL